jgi:hypothetical protein
VLTFQAFENSLALNMLELEGRIHVSSGCTRLRFAVVG